jgi:hypothetical protein
MLPYLPLCICVTLTFEVEAERDKVGVEKGWREIEAGMEIR